MGHYAQNGKRRSPSGHVDFVKRRRRILFPDDPVGPFCFLRQGRHGEPFGKRMDGARRRDARRFKQKIREGSIHDDSCND